MKKRGQAWIWIIGIIIAVLIIGSFFLIQPSQPESDLEGQDEIQEEPEQEIEIEPEIQEEPETGEIKEFTLTGVNYEFSIEEIRVNEGDTVTIQFTSEQGFHDWVVDEFSASTSRVSSGDTTEVTFTADQAGEYEYYCSVGNHRAQGMVGTLIVS